MDIFYILYIKKYIIKLRIIKLLDSLQLDFFPNLFVLIDIVFYLKKIDFFIIMFPIVLILGYSIIMAYNPINAILFFILLVSIVGINFLISGAEFMAFSLLLVYVGAIAILFIYIIMLLNIRLVELNEISRNYVGFSKIVVVFIFIMIFYVLDNSGNYNGVILNFNNFLEWEKAVYALGDVYTIGILLYTVYVIYTILGIALLLLGLIGAVFLSSEVRIEKDRSHIFEQLISKIIISGYE